MTDQELIDRFTRLMVTVARGWGGVGGHKPPGMDCTDRQWQVLCDSVRLAVAALEVGLVSEPALMQRIFDAFNDLVAKPWELDDCFTREALVYEPLWESFRH